MTTEKNSIQKYSEHALLAVEVATEVVAFFDDQPWSAPVQYALLGIKLIILMYLKPAAVDEPRLEPGESDPAAIAHTVESDPSTIVNIDDDPADELESDTEPDDPAGEHSPSAR